MLKMFWWWIFVMIIGIIIRSDILVAVSIICINMHYIADEIIKRIEKAAQQPLYSSKQ